VTRNNSGDEGRRDHVLGTAELRLSKPDRATFARRRRNPVTVVLDGVTGHYNIGAIFRPCDAFLVALACRWNTPRAAEFRMALIEANSAISEAMRAGQLEYRKATIIPLIRESRAFFALPKPVSGKPTLHVLAS
jgi:hypothetical protein